MQNVVFNNQKIKVNTFNENVSFNIRGAFDWNALRNINAKLSDIKVKVTRFLAEDTFNIELERFRLEKSDKFGKFKEGALGSVTSININNDKLLDSQDYRGENMENSLIEKIHHTAVDDVKFSNAKLINSSWMYDYSAPTDEDENEDDSKFLMMVTIAPKRYDDIKFMGIISDEAILIKSIKEITIKISSYANERGDLSSDSANSPFIVTKRFNYLLIIPTTLNSKNPSVKVADIYSFNDDSLEVSNDFYIKDIKYSSLTNNGKELLTHFVPFANEKVSFSLDDNVSQLSGIKVGEIVIDEPIFYDYQKQQMITGIDNNAMFGDIIPYNFQGKHIRRLQGDFNANAKNLTIQMMQQIDRPLLDVYDGLIRLGVKKNLDHSLTKMFWIRPEEWKIIQASKKIEPLKLGALKDISEEDEKIL